LINLVFVLLTPWDFALSFWAAKHIG
jgi:hypothetical protein